MVGSLSGGRFEQRPAEEVSERGRLSGGRAFPAAGTAKGAKVRWPVLSKTSKWAGRLE